MVGLRASVSVVLLLLAACGARSDVGTVVLGAGGDVDAGSGPDDAGSDGPQIRVDAGRSDGGIAPDAGAVVIGFSAGGRCNDHVSLQDEGVHPDGIPDACLKSFFNVPVNGLILVTTDEQGNPCCGQEWDTVVDADPLPQAQFGLLFTTGSQTPVLGISVSDDMSVPLLNDSKGRLPSANGGVLFMTDTGYFHTGTHLRLYGHTTTGEDPGWVASNVIAWP